MKLEWNTGTNTTLGGRDGSLPHELDDAEKSKGVDWTEQMHRADAMAKGLD